jgi:hypothetical protein
MSCRHEYSYEPCGCGEFSTNSNHNGGHSKDDDNDETWWSDANSGSADDAMGVVDDDKWWSGADSSGVGDDQWYSDAEASSSMATKSECSTVVGLGFVLSAAVLLIY